MNAFFETVLQWNLNGA